MDKLWIRTCKTELINPDFISHAFVHRDTDGDSVTIQLVGGGVVDGITSVEWVPYDRAMTELLGELSK